MVSGAQCVQICQSTTKTRERKVEWDMTRFYCLYIPFSHAVLLDHAGNTGVDGGWERQIEEPVHLTIFAQSLDVFVKGLEMGVGII